MIFSSPLAQQHALAPNAMPILLQPPFASFSIVMMVLALHYQLGPWPVLFRVPALSMAFLGVGLGLVVLARTYFTLRKTTLFVGRTSSQLVCDGPFRISRNPMYVGVVLCLLGMSFWFGTLPSLLAPVLSFCVLNFFHIPREEEMLRAHFGDAYHSYTRQVRRWL